MLAPRRGAAIAIAIAGALTSTSARAQPTTPPPGNDAVRPQEPQPQLKVSSWATDELDPIALTRVSLVTRATFSDGENVFSKVSAWSLEGRAHLRLNDAIALAATVPVGAISGPGDGAKLFFGNLAVGITGGSDVKGIEGPSGLGALKLRVGGGFDGYLPTAPLPKSLVMGLGQEIVSAFRAYEPQLYIPKMLSFRLRGHIEASTDVYTAAFELGLVPGFTLYDNNTGFELLLSAMARASALVTPVFEPFLEIACTPQIAGAGHIGPPLLVTPGARFHLGNTFNPSVFASLNFVAAKVIVFGVDLATLIPSGPEGKKAQRGGADEFDDRDRRDLSGDDRFHI